MPASNGRASECRRPGSRTGANPATSALEGPEAGSPLRYALTYRKAGLGVNPIRTDGSKAPLLPTWDEFKGRRPTRAELREWFDRKRAPGIAIVCGRVSGGLFVLD